MDIRCGVVDRSSSHASLLPLSAELCTDSAELRCDHVGRLVVASVEAPWLKEQLFVDSLRGVVEDKDGAEDDGVKVDFLPGTRMPIRRGAKRELVATSHGTSSGVDSSPVTRSGPPWAPALAEEVFASL